MSNQEQEHVQKIDCPEHAEQVKQQIIGGIPTETIEESSHTEFNTNQEKYENGRRQMHKASQKMWDQLVAKHGKEGATRIIQQEQNRMTMQRLNKRSLIQSAVSNGLYSQDNNMFNLNTDENDA